MTVISTSDDIQTKWAVKEISKINGPVYLRLSRLATPTIYDENQKFEIGKAIQIGDGTDGTIFATGVTVSEAIKAQEILKEKNIPFEENNIVIDENIINNSIKLKNTEIKIIPNTVYKKLNSSQKEKYFNLKDFISKIDIEKIISSYENE